MRKKIGKRIGPVPIALVAVFALAAFISVGLLLTVPNGQTAQAQGLPDGTPETAGTKCTVTVNAVADGANRQGALMAMVSGGGCVVSDDSVDVIFENEIVGDAGIQRIALYITGGEDFSDVQATNYVVDDGDASIVNLGKKGVDEEFLTIDEADEGPGGISRPGSETITVNRSMAKDGQVYLFGYFANSMWGFPTTDAYVGIPLGVFVDDDDRVKVSAAFEANALGLAGAAATAADAAILLARQADDGGLTQTDGIAPSFNVDSLADVTVANPVDDSTDDEQETVSNAKTRINMIKGHVKYVSSATVALKNAVVAAELAIMEAQAAIDGIEDGDPKHFMNQGADFVVKVDFRDTAVAAKLVAGEYDPEKGTSGSVMFTGTTDSNGPTRVLANVKEEADVYLAFRDENGVALAGFVQLTIDASVSGGADATFVGSNRTIQRVKLGEDIDGDMIKDPGEAVVKVQGLPENDAIRIPITADFNDGELVLEGYITREGDAEMVSATAYICERDDTDKQVSPMTTPKTYIEPAMVETEDACNTEIGALSTPGTSDDPTEVAALGPLAIFFIGAEAKDSVGNTVSEKAELSWSVTEDTDNEADAKTAIDGADSGDTNTAIMIAGIDDAKPGTYSITVTDQDGDASTTLEITVSAEATRISVACEPEVILTDSGLTECTVTVTDADGNIPSNLHKKRKDGVTVADKVRVAVRSTDVSLSGVDTNDDAELDDEGMATFSVLLREDAREGSVTVFVSSSIGDEKLRASTSIMYGDPPTAPGMPMNVMAEATSHDMIAVSWESPADDGGSAVTGYVLQSKTGTMDFMTIAASSAEIWWNTLDCPMMNAEIPDDSTPAPPMDDTDMTSPYCAMYAGLSAEATTVVDGVFADEYGTISGTSHSDMGLMAETTYYYRVSAINSAGKGEYSDGMAMAMTMTMMMPSMELGDTSIISAMSNAAGEATIMIMPGDNATKHYIWAQPTDLSQGMYSDEAAGDADMVTISGLTSDMNYWFIAIAGRGEGDAEEWSAWSGWTAETPIQ